MNTTYFLVLIIVLGFLARSRIVVLAALTLLLLKELNIDVSLSFLSNKGIEIGLIFLLLAILSPMIISPVEWAEVKSTLTSWRGVIAIIAGLLATQFNGMGLKLLNEMPQLIVGIILGSLLGIFFLGGIPVGPLMAAGIAALLVRLFEILAQLRG
ncbi:MAG: hypothetical protein PWR10_1488 [Halanaerobiales bacterium]|nr:hypothetical protein [Halanaerobiales bacterium]